MKNLRYLIIVFSCTLVQIHSQTLSWSGFPAGGTSYTTGIMTATITSSSPGFQNGAPKYYAGSTVGGGECGIAGGLALEHMFGNITNAYSMLTMDYTSGNTTNGLCGNISFQVKDINADETYQTFADWVEVSAIDGNNNPVANITATGGSNKTITTSGNTRIVKGYSNNSYGSRSATLCDNVTFTVTPPAGTTLKSVTLKYHPDYTASPNDYYNFTGPKRPAYQYISISSITVSAAAGPTAVVLTTTPASCTANNGTVTIGAVTGGTSPYQFNFNSLGLSTTTNFTNLASGTYPVVVQDNNGCTYSTSALIGITPGPTAIAASQTAASCGMSNGTVTLGAVTGGASPYQYNFNNLGLSTTTSFTSLAAGTYPLIVQDNNGCTYNTTVTVNPSTGPTAIVTTPTAVSCGTSNGTVTLGAVTGGTSPYQYNFNNLGLSTTTSFTSLAAGTYPLIVQDNNGCTYNTTVTVNPSTGPTAIVTTPTAASCGTSNGTVTLGAVTGGTSPYQYNFNNLGLSTTTSFTSLAAGTYPLIVQDNNGCTYNTTVTVNSSTGPTAIAVNQTSASCGLSDGTVTLGAVTGGISPYQYNFNNLGLSTTTGFTNLAAGTYPLIVQDNGGCVYNTSVTITSASGPSAVAVTVNNGNCGSGNGSVIIGAVTGGTAPYDYNFNGQGFAATTNFNSLADGTYSISVQDDNGCIYNTSVTVTGVQNSPTAVASNVTDASCAANNGSVVLGSITGGTAPFQYNFNGTGFSANTSFGNLGAGTYPLIIQDDNGCTYSTNFTVSSSNGPTAVAISTINDACAQGNGSVMLGTVTGGTAPYQFNFNGQGLSANGNYSSLSAGTYTVVVQDASGCTFSTTATVGGTAGPTNISTNMSTETCNGSNGSVTLGAVTGGTSPYTYNFNNQGFSPNTSYTNLSAGTYDLIVQDASGCQYATSVMVSALSGGPQSVNYTATPPDCGANNGAFEIADVVGGTAPYTYVFDGIAISNTTISNVAAGSHALEITDANGCIMIAQLTMDGGAGMESLHIPNVFTPDGDLANETWFIDGSCIQALECVIVNRWGEVMETFDAITDEWDGNFNSSKVTAGTYFYKAKVTFWSGKTEDYHGFITVIY